MNLRDIILEESCQTERRAVRGRFIERRAVRRTILDEYTLVCDGIVRPRT